MISRFYKLIFVILFIINPAWAVTCRLKTEGYGTFVGTGPTQSLAFEKAVERCFDSLNWLKEKKSKQTADEEQQISFIDYCVNLSCQ